MNIKTMRTWAAVAICGCLALTSARGNTILQVGLTDSHAVGEIIPGAIGIPGGQLANDQADVNYLIPLGLSTTSVINVPGANDNPNTFVRSGNSFSSLPSAVTTGAVLASGVGSGTGNVTADGTWVYLTLAGSGYQYLVAKYDGPNITAGAEVWSISDLASGTTIQIPQFAAVQSGGNLAQTTGQYQITSWTLLNPVPDGGLTLAMLGSGLTLVGLLRRKLS